MKKLLIIGAAAMTVTAFAGSAALDGTDFVVSADSGETYTYSSAVGNYSRLVKRGAGEVELTAASSGFAGSVVVEAGTLTIKNKSAVGASSVPITVQDGATLHLNLGSASFGHKITIAGTGVGGAGAFRSSGSSDDLIVGLTLSADATIDVSQRWGMMYNTYNIDLAGHTLTRIGGNTWMVYNHVKSTDSPGTIINTEGSITFQNSPIVDANVTIDVRGGTFDLFNVSGNAQIRGAVILANGRSARSQYGKSQPMNHIGAVHLSGVNGNSATLDTGSGYAMTLNGALTGDNGVSLAVKGTGSLWMNGAIDIPTASVSAFYGGSIFLDGDVARRIGFFIQRSGNTLSLSDGRCYFGGLRIANGGPYSSRFRQTGGVFGLASSDSGRIGESNGSCGYYTLEGGEAHFSNTVYMAEWPGSFGAFRQTGGLFEMKRPASGIGDKVFYAGCGGSGLFVQTGGTNDTLAVGASQYGGFQMGTNGLCEATISGTGTLFRTSLVELGDGNSICTNIFNVGNGAVVKANRLRKSGTGAGTHAYVNVDGGTLMPTFAWGWSFGVASWVPDHFVVWKNGVVIDTSENSTNSGAGGSDISIVFEAPTGKGVESVALPDLTGKKYIGIARVVFEDATGWGASAYAEYDFDTKTLSRIVVTSRGCNYSNSARAYLESPDRSTRYECALSLGENAGLCGGLVKRGAATLTLTGANTITGGIAVESGMLQANASGVIPYGTPVRVESGATLDLCKKEDITISTFTGAGTVSRGSVTVTNAVRATCVDLFAGRCATFSSNLTFAHGTVFEITDAENLDAFKHTERVVALTTTDGTVQGSPKLKLTTSAGMAYEGTASWSLRFAADGKSIKFGVDKGMVISVK